MSDSSDKPAAGVRRQPPYPVIHGIECKSCGRCVADCPRHVLSMGTEFNARGYRFVTYAGEGCVGCASCFYTCPEPAAIELHLARKRKE